MAARAMEPVCASWIATWALNWKFRKSVAREGDWTRPRDWRMISLPSMVVVWAYSDFRVV